MTTADIIYEAACNLSNARGNEGYDLSCVRVLQSGMKNAENWAARGAYSRLMSPHGDRFAWVKHVESAANSVGWGYREYRTFMMLMAAEALA